MTLFNSSRKPAAYLTVCEIFPLELRAFAIAIFYSLGTLVGGAGAPILFGYLIATNSRLNVALGYGLGAVLMLAGALCERLIGVEAAGKAWDRSPSRCRAHDVLTRPALDWGTPPPPATH